LTWRELSDLFVQIELELISSLQRNLTAHKAWEEKEGFRWPAWQEEKIQNLESFRRENQGIIGKYVSIIDQETEAMLRDQYAEGIERINQEVETHRTAGHYFLPASRDITERSFFGVNDRKLQSLIHDIQHTEKRAETAALRLMDDVYRQTVHKANVAMSIGAVNLPKAIDMATEDFLSKGINCIEYKDGKRVNIADYVQMALRTASMRSYLQGEAKKRAELGIDTVLVSQYGACSETCLPWQGKVYIDDVWGEWKWERNGDLGKSRNGGLYPLLSVAVKNGLFHPNCRHTLSTWYEGISILPKPMDKEAIRKNARLEQKQRAMEREIRKWKRLETGSIFPEDRKRYSQKRKAAQTKLREFINNHSDALRRDYWREKIYDKPESNNTAEFFIEQAKKRYASGLTMNASSDTLSAEDIYAIDQYKRSGVSYALNNALRQDSLLTDRQREVVRALDLAIVKLPVYQGKVYRSISADMIEDISLFWNRYTPGNFVVERQYVSSSTEVYDETMEIQMIIQSKHGRDMRIYNPLEQEILFRRGTMFFVERKEGNSIWLKEI
jgi:hypothetical protein